MEESQRLAACSDQELAARVATLRGQLGCRGLEEELAIAAFALVREITGRAIGQRHYETQIIGGWLLLKGMLAEMETGEGKTLMATLPVCTAALAGIPVHVITANDYLVERDAELMSPVYRLLDLSVGTVTERERDAAVRRKAYACDITYCTSKQLAFDYLRDRVAMGHRRGRLGHQLRRLTQIDSDPLLLRGLCFAIVDEADSVLIDDAGTPLILSREVAASLDASVCEQALQLAAHLKEGADYRVHARFHDVELTAAGKQRIASAMEEISEFLVRQALRARCCYQRDREYLVTDGKVHIIDANTGRALPDHSWEQGLHQLIEVKEGCEVTGTRETIARISYQRLFRRYLHLAGMTGTAREVAAEFWSVYGLEVVAVPTHKPVRRIAGRERVLPTASAKHQAIIERLVQVHQSERPVLLATTTVAESEQLSRLLDERGLVHEVLNARQNRREAEVIAAAGEPRAITIATNMAGRGTDIKLAPNVVRLGGLHVIATSRNEARRIDRQLYGRCGRQGDPGSYESFLSLDDGILKKYVPLSLIWAMRMVGKWRVTSLGSLLTRLAQRRAERYQARLRRSLMQYDQRVKEVMAFSGPQE
jgi:preprotein translocase subunit SecA